MSCTLCGQPLPKRPLKEGEAFFCCAGCKTVHAVLQAKNSEKQQNDPLFQEALKKGLLGQNRNTPNESKTPPPGETKKLYLEISNMWCPSCARAIELLLKKQRGIAHCLVDYTTDLATITFYPTRLSKEAIFLYLKKLGYEATPLLYEASFASSKRWLLRCAISAVLSLNLMMLSLPLYVHFFKRAGEGFEKAIGWLSLLFALPLFTYSAAPLWRRFFVMLKTGKIGMETLVILGAGTSFFTSLFHLLQGATHHLYFDSMGMIITLVLLGKHLELTAKSFAKKRLYHLFRSLPKKGRKKEKHQFTFAPLKEVNKNDTLCVLSGEEIPLEGIVTSGKGVTDESILTGEADPKQKKAGDLVFAGSRLLFGTLCFKVQKTQKEGTSHKILKAIEEGMLKKRQTLSWTDKIASYFVPLVLGVATLPFFWALPFEEALIRFASVLLISCPCAMGIAIPLAEAFLLAKLGKEGVVVNDRAALFKLASITDVAFDKTGTLTEGKLVADATAFTPLEKQHIKTLASHSNHPLSMALQQLCTAPLLKISNSQQIAGQGVIGVFNNTEYALGSKALFHEVEEVKEGFLGSVVYFGKKDEIGKPLTLQDTLREETFQVLQELSPLSLHLLSGDRGEVVKEVAKLGYFSSWQGGLDPFQKKETLEKWKQEGKRVAMVGDGINDTCAFTSAEVSISVQSPCELASHVSDLVLTKQGIAVIPTLFPLAKLAKKVAKQNLFWAFFYNCLGIALALKGALSPLSAALAMVLSSCCVIINTFRIRAFARSDKKESTMPLNNKKPLPGSE